MDSLKELIQFLQPNRRIDLKAVALTHILGLTGSPDSREMLFQLPEIIQAIFLLTEDKTKTIAKDAVLSLINLTSEESGALKVFEISKDSNFNIIEKALNAIINENSELSDPWSMVLSNLTRAESLANAVIDEIEKHNEILFTLVKAFSKLDYNKQGGKLHYLGPIFCNLTQISRARQLFCNPELHVLEKITPFISYEGNIVRRGGTIGIIKNICFDPVYHDIVLNEDGPIFHRLLYPLAGPEEFTDEENDKLPMELQYLGEDKKREEDPDLRKMLLECLLQLCATKKSREFLRSKGTYEILREYHKWEAKIGGDKEALLACENVVDILIKKEDEIAIDNLKHVEVPEEMSKNFKEIDQNLLLND